MDLQKIILTKRDSFRSIKDFLDTELSLFTVLTGVNGVGKSHLLEAIEAGAIAVKDIDPRMGMIKRFDPGNFVPGMQVSARSVHALDEHNRKISEIETEIGGLRNRLNELFQKHGIDGSKWVLPKSRFNLDARELVAEVEKIPSFRLAGAPSIEVAVDNILRRRGELERETIQRLDSHRTGFGSAMKALSLSRNVSLVELSKAELRYSVPLLDRGMPLQVQLATWFTTWRAVYDENNYFKYLHRHLGDNSVVYITEDADFRKIYGEEPWVIVNRTLATAGLPYEFNAPLRQQADFHLKLVNVGDREEIPPDALSSGEKALLAAVFLVSQAAGMFGPLVHRLKLVLLDEVDSTLHPAYTKNLLNLLNRELVDRYKVGVILTTHSPSTVALAPEGSVFELVRRPRAIRPVSAGQAIQALSAGFLSIYRTDKIVIVESSVDAEYYQKAFTGLVRVGRISPVPGLKFIGASVYGDDGRGGGRAQVLNWAPKLGELGLERFCGLIDLDEANQATQNVIVTKRSCLENYVYDPVTVAAYVVHRGVGEPFPATTCAPTNSYVFINDSPANQRRLDQFLKWLAQDVSIPAICDNDRISIGYGDLGVLQLPKWWLSSPKDSLVSVLRRSINGLAKKNNREALLKKDCDELTSFQTFIMPQILPDDLANSFRELQAL